MKDREEKKDRTSTVPAPEIRGPQDAPEECPPRTVTSSLELPGDYPGKRQELHMTRNFHRFN